ncbi:MAG: hypothetical protein LBD24_02765, partial [Spirochaetaceae bacterium]|nr:hypothetical protein [Spirochaetaceae bacterium]
GAKRSRALVGTSPLSGHGVALLGGNRRPCLKPSETGRAWAAASLLTGQGVAPLSSNRRPFLNPSETGRRLRRLLTGWGRGDTVRGAG